MRASNSRSGRLMTGLALAVLGLAGAPAAAQSTLTTFCGNETLTVGTVNSDTVAVRGTSTCTEAGYNFVHGVFNLAATLNSGYGEGSFTSAGGDAFSLYGFTASNLTVFRDEGAGRTNPIPDQPYYDMIEGTRINITANYANGTEQRFVFTTAEATANANGTYSFDFGSSFVDVLGLSFSVNPVGLLVARLYDANGSLVVNSVVDAFDGSTFRDVAIQVDDVRIATTVAAVPEPSTYVLMLLPLALVGAVARRRR